MAISQFHNQSRFQVHILAPVVLCFFADFYFITKMTDRPYLYIISSQYLSKQVNAAETIARQKDKKLKEAENKINTLVSQSD